MICRFVADAAGLATVAPNMAKDAVIGAAQILRAEFPHLDTRLLDSEIWAYESNRARVRSGRSRKSKQQLSDTDVDLADPRDVASTNESR